MQKKHIAFIIIIQFLIENPNSSIGKIYNVFKIFPDGKGKYDNRGNYPVTQRGVNRYVHELVDLGIIQFQIKSEKLYKISDNMLALKSTNDKKSLENLINTLIEVKQKNIIQRLSDISSREELNNETMNQILNRIYVPFHADNINDKLLYKIQKAIATQTTVLIKYNEKIHKIIPLAIVKNKQGTKEYLFYIFKGKLREPFILSKIQDVTMLDINFNKSKKYIDNINERWNIEGGKKIKVEILFSNKIYKDIILNLKNRKTASFLPYNNDYFLYKDEIRGIDDFKNWIRPHINMCYIIKPTSLKNELLNKNIKKLERYGVDMNEL